MTDPTDLKARFRDRLDDVNAGLLGLTDDLRLVPMSHQLRDGDDTFYFITAAGTDLYEAVKAAPKSAIYALAEGGKGLYARVEGDLAEVTDPALIEELWNFVADAWFEDGKQDDDVRILALTPKTAEVWLTTTSGVAFLYQIARAKITGQQPDMGEQGTVTY